MRVCDCESIFAKTTGVCDCEPDAWRYQKIWSIVLNRHSFNDIMNGSCLYAKSVQHAQLCKWCCRHMSRKSIGAGDLTSWHSGGSIGEGWDETKLPLKIPSRWFGLTGSWCHDIIASWHYHKISKGIQTSRRLLKSQENYFHFRLFRPRCHARNS